MSSVKISQLNPSSNLNPNPSHSIFPTVDLDTKNTNRISAKELGDTLYSNNQLVVGSGGYPLPNLVAQFTGVGSNYVQINAQNLNSNGTVDYVTTADIGNDINYYIDLGFTNSHYNNISPFNSLGTAIEPLSGYLYVQGDMISGKKGNLVIGTTMSETETRIIAGGVNSENVITKITSNGLELQSNRWLKFGDGTYQNTAASPANYSISAYSFANTVNAYAYSANVYNILYTDSVVAANLTVAQSYTDTANSFIQSQYLANTSGVFNGSLSFTGNIDSKGLISIINPNISDNSVFLNIIGSASGLSQQPSNPGYTIHTTSIDGQGNRITGDAFGSAANNYASFIGRRGRGTAASPSSIQANDIIARFGGNGYGTTKFSQYGDGRIEIVASENFTDTSKKTRIDFLTTESGSNNANIVATFNGNTATFIGTLEPTKGFIFTPKTLIGAQTAITLDFSTDSVIRGTFTTGGVTITPTNFISGKVVEVWLTNLAGNGQSITHGLTENNSSTGSTNISVSSNRCAHLRYFSIDGDLANTFVSATYS